MNKSWFDLPLEAYLERRRDWLSARAEENPILKILCSYEGASTFIQTQWTKEYYEHLIREVKK